MVLLWVVKGNYKRPLTIHYYMLIKEKSYKRNMMFLFAKLTKEIIFVCTIFLFIYVMNDL